MIKLYSNDCPKCKVLKTQLDKYGVEYEVDKNFEKLISEGFTSLPVMELEDGKMLKFNEAITYVIGGEE